MRDTEIDTAIIDKMIRSKLRLKTSWHVKNIYDRSFSCAVRNNVIDLVIGERQTN